MSNGVTCYATHGMWVVCRNSKSEEQMKEARDSTRAGCGVSTGLDKKERDVLFSARVQKRFGAFVLEGQRRK